MKVIDAVAAVLEEAREPLHYRRITERIIAKGLWESSGKTPWGTVLAQILRDISKQGATSRFVKTEPGWFALRSDSGPQSHEGEPFESEAAGLSFTEAAVQVLSASRDREPMHYKAITQAALDAGLIRTKSQTPAATMYAQILGENRRREARGESLRFLQHGRGMLGLTSWQPAEVAGLVERKNREVRQALLDRARRVSSDEFEILVGELLTSMGFEEVEVTRRSGDGGIDLRGTLVAGDAVRTVMAVQAKRWKKGSNIQAPIVQQVRGALGAHERGLIVTTSDFSSGALNEAQRNDAPGGPVALINGEQLAALLAKFQIGARIERYELYALDEVEGE